MSKSGSVASTCGHINTSVGLPLRFTVYVLKGGMLNSPPWIFLVSVVLYTCPANATLIFLMSSQSYCYVEMHPLRSFFRCGVRCYRWTDEWEVRASKLLHGSCWSLLSNCSLLTISLPLDGKLAICISYKVQYYSPLECCLVKSPRVYFLLAPVCLCINKLDNSDLSCHSLLDTCFVVDLY